MAETGGRLTKFWCAARSEETGIRDSRHEYQRDAAGRVTRDAVGAVGSGIDATVRAITVAYDAAGRMREVLSTLDAAGTQVDSGVGFTYTPLWQVASVVQNPTGRAFTQAGAADPAARSVSYAYATVLPSTAATPPAAGDNFSRLAGTTARVRRDGCSSVAGMVVW